MRRRNRRMVAEDIADDTFVLNCLQASMNAAAAQEDMERRTYAALFEQMVNFRLHIEEPLWDGQMVAQRGPESYNEPAIQIFITAALMIRQMAPAAVHGEALTNLLTIAVTAMERWPYWLGQAHPQFGSHDEAEA